MPNINDRGRLWAEIDLDALTFNYRQAQKYADGTPVLAVLKADAYGHGAVECARALLRAGAPYLAVAAPEEALQLRANGIDAPLLLLGIAPECIVRELIDQKVELSVNSLETAHMLSRLAGQSGVTVHVQLDTGMSRLGFDTTTDIEQAARDIVKIAALPGLHLKGVFTHLCVSDTQEEDAFTLLQIERYAKTTDRVIELGTPIPIRHCANSAAIIRFPQARFDMVREGIMLYGISPDTWMQQLCELHPVMSLRTRIMHKKTITSGATVGSGRTYTDTADPDISTTSIGYTDGLPLLTAVKIGMRATSKRPPQSGRLFLYMTITHTTASFCAQGDVVTVLGKDGGECITIEDLTAHASTIPHEMLCNVGKRVPRIYIEDKKTVARTELIV